MAQVRAAPAPFSLLEAIGWGFYLASSWTWCIGMFLPVLLVRDFGLAGFVAFALPNVIGAAAMGWVLRRAGAITILSRHRAAVQLFSVVTVAFQLWFLTRDTGASQRGGSSFDLIGDLGGLALRVPVATVLFGLSLVLQAFRRTFLMAGAAAWVASISCAASLASSGELRESINGLSTVQPGFGMAQLLFLAPVCTFGFLLCPYLDATFLRARASTTDVESRVGFSLGFGVFFYAMILLTLGYSVLVGWAGGSGTGLTVVAVHIWGQALFTVAVHAVELVRLARGRGALISLACITVGLALLGRFAMPLMGRLGVAIEPFEVIYRLFMSFYGLAFPAYVWLCMIPTRDGHHGPRRDKLLALAASVGMAAPFFYMGFIERQALYLGPGLLIVLAARLTVRGARERATGSDLPA